MRSTAMNKQPVQDDNDRSNAVKDPDDWATGEETMTGAQASYLETFVRKLGKNLIRRSPRPPPQKGSISYRRRPVGVGTTSRLMKKLLQNLISTVFNVDSRFSGRFSTVFGGSQSR
jgi:hypothetical protein